ncbi:MAG TPA: 50S ribosomal protein L23 [Candidatus Woesebacteria bacterium]|nr:50S ribosomal protein L23 [Candidatus Woesebacteria bacterium]
MLLQLIKKPLITESTVKAASQNNTYTFIVAKTARKHQIAQAVEQLFKVKVEKVRTVATPLKRKKTGKRRLGTVSALGKKAMVSVKSGQTIDLFEIEGKA